MIARFDVGVAKHAPVNLSVAVPHKEGLFKTMEVGCAFFSEFAPVFYIKIKNEKAQPAPPPHRRLPVPLKAGSPPN